MEDFNKIQHLYARAGFGVNIDKLADLRKLSVKQAIEKLFQTSATPQPLTLVTANPNSVMNNKADMLARKMFLKEQKDQEQDLNIAWINQMSTTEAQLREKMTLFWHNHFACRTPNPWYAQQLNNIHRNNALGNFKTMLFQVSQSPAMIQFLNNQQNKKGRPNENFAREVMELFTVGRGNYTEQDIKEGARAFTGWSINGASGEFEVRDGQHDTGPKTFMGQTGNFGGEDILNTLLKKKETAQFVCKKLYRYLVNDEPDMTRVNAMADLFYNNGYEISPVLRYIFTADWFYAPNNTGNMIKSPVDLLVGLNRQFYITYANKDVLRKFQQTLGQLLFYPPNVAGWAGGRNWIDSSTLMFRLKIPSTILSDGVIDFSAKTDPEDEALLAAMSARKKPVATNNPAQTTADWNRFLAGIPKGATKSDIATAIMATGITGNLKTVVDHSTDMRSMVVALVSTPEYQMC